MYNIILPVEIYIVCNRLYQSTLYTAVTTTAHIRTTTLQCHMYNIPVIVWCVQHVYRSCLRKGVPRITMLFGKYQHLPRTQVHDY
jgi:hypothetical protein